MKSIEVIITVKVPEDISQMHLQEWLKYVTGNNGGISLTNPLCNKELEATSVRFWL